MQKTKSNKNQIYFAQRHNLYTMPSSKPTIFIPNPIRVMVFRVLYPARCNRYTNYQLVGFRGDINVKK